MTPDHRRTLQRVGVVLGLVFAATGAGAAPAAAHDLASIVRAPLGCDWANGRHSVLDWADIRDRSGNFTLATGYLLWNGDYGENCVVTQRVGRAHGVAGFTEAVLERRGMSTITDHGAFAHYAAAAGGAAGTCVRWWSTVQSLGGGPLLGTGRIEWGNCG